MLSFQHEENWIGGTYYILNIIRSLNRLSDDEKPSLTILHRPETSIADITDIAYPYLEFFTFHQQLPSWKSTLNKIAARMRLGRNIFKIRIPLKHIDAFYPAPLSLDASNIEKYYTWIPDFQEHYLPQYFSEREIRDRKLQQVDIVRRAMPVVFSSQNAMDDFNKFYPSNKNTKCLLRFASVLDYGFNNLRAQDLFRKFGIEKPFFIVTNQFWKHKDHTTVIHAFKEMLPQFGDIQLVLTGKEHDYRNPEYPASLKKYVHDNDLIKSVLFLGFIDRQEQLKLMQESLAIVQPSRFEGWSTVVEDAKALDKFIILSGIPLHREQIQHGCLFFNPGDHEDLMIKMKEFMVSPAQTVEHHYSKAILNFARNFKQLFN